MVKQEKVNDTPVPLLEVGVDTPFPLVVQQG